MTSIYGAGRLDRRAQVVRRTGGQTSPDAKALWVNFRPTGASAFKLEETTLSLQEGVATTRASDATRSIRAGDRIVIEDVDFNVTSTPFPDRTSGMVSLGLVEAVTSETLARAFTVSGRLVTIERTVPNGTPIGAPNVRARITGADPEEVAGGNYSVVRRVVILAADVSPPLRPLKQGDRILVDGLRLTFTSRPDDQTHRDGEILLAYEGIVAGS